MLSTRKQVKIISLGEVVTPDVMKAIQAFTVLIAGKKQTDPLAVGKSIGLVLQQNMQLINNFKLGILNEKEFTEQMIEELKKVTSVELNTYEFDYAWNAMNPKFDQFETLLKQAAEYNSQPKQQTIFISFTNPKDIRNLISELEKNKQNYKVINEELVEICGIQLYTTYAAKQTKAELIESVIKKLNTKSPYQSTLANSMSNVLNLKHINESEQVEIKYIHCVNDVKDPILKAGLDKTNQEIEKKTEDFFVDTILWMKREQTLSDVLQDQVLTSKMIAVSKL